MKSTHTVWASIATAVISVAAFAALAAFHVPAHAGKLTDEEDQLRFEQAEIRQELKERRAARAEEARKARVAKLKADNAKLKAQLAK